RPDALAGGADGVHHAVDVARRAGVLVDAVRRHLVGLLRRVDADAVAGGAAEEAVDGDAPQLAGDVPQRHVDAGDGVDHERAAADVAVGPVELLPQVLYPRRVLP